MFQDLKVDDLKNCSMDTNKNQDLCMIYFLS